MTAGKYMYVSGTVRNLYLFHPGTVGDLIRQLFWIHPQTKVIHPSNRGLLCCITQAEADQFPGHQPKAVTDILKYKENQKIISRYFSDVAKLSSSSLSQNRRKLFARRVADFEKTELFRLIQSIGIPVKEFREVLSTYQHLLRIEAYPELWAAFIYAKFHTHSYAFNGRLLSYHEVTYGDHKYSDCVATFFRNLCIVANVRPNNFQNLKEDTIADHIEWIDYLVTLHGFDYVVYPEIASTRKNLDVFLGHLGLTMEEIGFQPITDGWHFRNNDIYEVEAYMIPSHASMKATFLTYNEVKLHPRYDDYTKVNADKFLDINDAERAARFVVNAKHTASEREKVVVFVARHIEELSPFFSKEQLVKIKEMLKYDLDILGESFYRKRYPVEYGLIQEAINAI
jgi:hypothetical protein